MFDGVPSDQFHQFIAAAAAAAAAASSTTSQLQSPPPPPPLSFPLHVSPSTFPSFDLYPSSGGGGGGAAAAAAHQPLQVPHLLHPLHHHSSAPHKNDQDKEESALVSINLEPQRERSMLDLIDPWSNDEVLALLRIRSSMENWYPDFTWEHVSRKLAEQGFKRSAEKCKEKFEQESRYFNTTMNYNKNYRFFSELEELYHGETPHQQDVDEKNQKGVEKPNDEDKSLEEDSRNETVVGNPCLDQTKEVEDKSEGKKRKRHNQHKSFEMFKGFCEAVVNKMMAQQEEMHSKLLEDMVKRDEEKLAREEAWKKREMDRINKEIEIRAHEQAIAGDRQATIIGFLKKFTSNNPVESQHFGNNEGELSKVPNSSNPPTSPSSILPQNPNLTSHLSPQNKQLEAPTSSRKVIVPHQNPSSLTTPTNPNAPIDEAQPSQNPTSIVLESKNPNSLNTQKSPSAPTSFPSNTDKDQELGKRWPRDEVLALINLRCNLNGEDKEGAKGPLWERISQGMLALGYKRSAKRCKEKWENINKYFRKTKNVSRKRSLDSRTCPYFHQLSTLYNQGTLVAPSSEAPAPENRLNSSENHSASPENQVGGASSNANMHAADEGEENVAQLPAYDFKF